MTGFNLGGGFGSADPAARTWSIALDGGTTNTRARLLCGDVVIATARRAVGVRDAAIASARTGTPASDSGDREPRRDALRRAVREVVAEVQLEWRRLAEGDPPARLVAAGMLSSEIGLVAVPHVLAPAGLDELAHSSVPVHLSEIHDRPILVVPGVRTPPADGPDGWLEADVMRGEECETLGALRTLLADGRAAPGRASAFLWPGSHTKLVEVDAEGRIARSFTTLAGEVLEAVGHHTILAASLPAGWPDSPDPDAVAAGARAVARHGLGRGAFLVRIAALTSALDPAARASFWMGAVIAADVDSLTAHPILEPGRTAFVGGREPLRSLYAGLLARRHDGPVVALDETLSQAASALGAIAVAERRAALGLAIEPVEEPPEN